MDMGYHHLLDTLALRIPKILLPKDTIDMRKWAVVACDQYTSQPAYWKRVAEFVGDAPSSLHLIFPEAFLGRDNRKRIERICTAMQEYQDTGVFREPESCFMLIQRTLKSGVVRNGLIVALDLEHYDYSKNSASLIRPTEATIPERITPRIAIRKGASLELPHIMVLIDDPQKTVIEPLFAAKHDEKNMRYDSPLMLDAGSIAGFAIREPEHIAGIAQAIAKLADKGNFTRRYGLSRGAQVILYAVGDGNHSLATAKALWEEMKKKLSEEEQNEHPARFALVELVNLHDDGLAFEPIHRIACGMETQSLLSAMQRYFQNKGAAFSCEYPKRTESLSKAARRKSEGAHHIPFFTSTAHGMLSIERQLHSLAAGSLQECLDELVRHNPALTVDYIHGEKELSSLVQQHRATGFILPQLRKGSLFESVIRHGILPKKTFSMGEAEDKRFYIEARRIRK